jgi:hypothetical protein
MPQLWLQLDQYTENTDLKKLIQPFTVAMGSHKKSGSGFWSAVVSWFSCFGSPKATSTGGHAGYDPAGGMAGAAKHFSSAHKINFGC